MLEPNNNLRQLILYILSHPDYKEGGVKKLNKLLYFVDFYYYREHEELISGATYAKAPMGPLIDRYKEVFSELVSKGDLRLVEEGETTCYVPLVPPDVTVFTATQIDHIGRVLDRYGKLSGKDLEWISHQQQPWVLTENYGDRIDPDLALLIDDSEGEFEVVQNEKLKNELEDLAKDAR